MAPPASPFEAAAERHGIPVNTLAAIGEIGGIADADALGASLSKMLAEGRSVPDAISVLVPGASVDAVRQRAIQIGEGYGVAAPAPAPAPEPRQRGMIETIVDPFGTTGEVVKGVARGVAGAVSAGAKSLGYDETAERAGEIAENPALAADVRSFRDIDGVGAGAKYITGLLGESGPEMAAITGAAVAGTAAAGPAGGITAALATSAFFNTGRNIARQEQEQPAEEPSLSRALGAGLAQGGLDALVPGRIASGFFGRLLGAVAERGGVKLAKEVGEDTLIEAATETGQQLIEIGQANPDLLRIMVDPQTPEEVARSEQLIDELAESAVGGAAAGGAFSAGGRLLGSAMHKPAPELAPEPPLGLPAPALITPPPPKPAGPLERALADGPAPLAADLLPGAEIEIDATDPETGEVLTLPGIYLGEHPEGIRVRNEDGTDALIPREEIESGLAAVRVPGQIDAPNIMAETAAPAENYSDPIPIPAQTGLDPAEVARVQAAVEREIVPGFQPAEPVPGGLGDQSLGNVQPQLGPSRREDSLPSPQTPEAIRERIAYLREARRSGTNLKRINAEIRTLEERLADIAPAAPVAMETAGGPEPEGAVAPAPSVASEVSGVDQGFTVNADFDPADYGGAKRVAPVEEEQPIPASPWDSMSPPERRALIQKTTLLNAVRPFESGVRAEMDKIASRSWSQLSGAQRSALSGRAPDSDEWADARAGAAAELAAFKASIPTPEQFMERLKAAEQPIPGATPETDPSPAPVPETPRPIVEDIRQKAAIIRGIDQATADKLAADLGISVKIDEKAGGYLISRKQADRVRAALGNVTNPDIAPEQAPTGRAGSASPEATAEGTARPSAPLPKHSVRKQTSGNDKGMYVARATEGPHEGVVGNADYTEQGARKELARAIKQREDMGIGVAPSNVQNPQSAPAPRTDRFVTADHLDPREKKALAQERDAQSDAGDVLQGLDALVRRAAYAVGQAGGDAAAAARGEDVTGQEAFYLQSAIGHMKLVLDAVREQGNGRAEGPDADVQYEPGEDAPEGGNAVFQAVWAARNFMDEFESAGLPIDTREGGDYDATRETPRMDEAAIFPAPEGGTRNVSTELTDFVSPDEAAARVERWKAVAKEIGATGANKGKIVLSLFDYSGKWSQPWRDAGYSVIQHDIKTGSDLLTDAWIYDRIEEARKEGLEFYGVLSACPCTTFAGSGARWWAGRHDVESPETLKQVFGEKALSSGAKSALEYNVMLFEASRDAIALAAPTGFHALENPTGRIERATGLPEPTLRFDPSNFGDPYTKKTGIYGSFKADLPTANVDPVEGSKVQSKLRGYDALDKEARSDTPEGFAYAFFMANDPQARERMAEPPAKPARVVAPQVPALEGMAPMGAKPRSESQQEQSWREAAEHYDKLVSAPDLAAFSDEEIKRARRHADKMRSRVAQDIQDGDESQRPMWEAFGRESDHFTRELDRRKAPAPKPDSPRAKREAKAKAKAAPAAIVTQLNDDFGNWSVPTGAILKSTTGRALAPAPKWGGSNNRLTKLSIARQREWLKAEALAEAEARGDQHMMREFRRLNPKNWTMSDADMVNEYLFGTANGPAGDPVSTPAELATMDAAIDEALAKKPTPAPFDPWAAQAGDRDLETAGGFRAGDAVDVPNRTIGRSRVAKIYERQTLAGKLVMANIEGENGKRLNVAVSDLRPVSPAATSTPAEIAAARKDVDRNPTDGQKEAGNYQMGHVKVHGLDVTIETPKGGVRRGKAPDGTEWSVKMPADYGYIRRTEGADGDHVDVYLGPKLDADRVYVFDQMDPATGKFDEHKVVMGAAHHANAREIYDGGFSDGSGGRRRMASTMMTVDTFKAWLDAGDTSVPAYRSPSILAAKQARDSKGDGAIQSRTMVYHHEEQAPRAPLPPETIPEALRDNDAADLPPPPVKLPEGYFQTYAKPMTKAEAEGTSYPPRTIKAIITRQSPFSAIDGYGATVDEALENAARQARRQIAREGDRRTESRPEERPAAAPAYGASNKLVTAERAAELRERLKAKLRDQLNSGIDPEILAIGTELAVFHVEAGARRFLDFARAVADDLGTTPAKLRPYLRSWYNGARDMLEDHGQSIEGMDDPAAVRAALSEISDTPAEAVVSSEPATEEPHADDARGDAADDAEPLAGDVAGADEEARAGEGAEGEPGLREADAPRDGYPDEGGDVRGAGVDGESSPVLPGADGEPRPVAAGPVGRTEERPDALAGENPGNFRITAETGVGTGTDGQKIEANIAAIRTLKALQAERRFPTADEQATLARYVGWGGLKPVFDVKKAGKTDMYGRAQAELREILTPDEFNAANASVRNAHYTAPGVVEAMWRAARHFGFKGGRVLEPTVGVGNFLGLQPADLAAASEWHAAELDTITGGIAQMLYPEANVIVQGFEKAPFADGAFDFAIGNPPFGSMTITDKSPNRAHLNGLKIHNYIISKTGMHLRPGGIMSMVVTHRFLDTANPEARDVLAKDFRFLGAIRLPNDAFRANAGTEVTTDIVFFQKLKPGEARDRDAAWLDTEGKLATPTGEARVNRYFAENPGQILGQSGMDGEMYANRGRRQADGGPGEYTVHSDGRDLGKAIDDLLAGPMADLAGILDSDNAAAPALLSQSNLPVGGMMLDGDEVIRRGMDDEYGNAQVETVTPDSFWKDFGAEYGAAAKAAAAMREARFPRLDDVMAFMEATAKIAFTAKGGRKSSPTRAEQALYDIYDASQEPSFRWNHDAQLAEIEKAAANRRLGVKGFNVLKGLLGLRRQTLALITAEQNDDPRMGRMRKDLNDAYDAFVAAHGFIGENVAVLDGDIGLEVGLESSFDPAVSAAVAKRDGVDPRPAQAEKAAILSKRIIFPVKEITSASSPEDALNISMAERGRVDLAYMSGLLGRPADEIRNELMKGDEPSIYYDPAEGAYVHAEAYLSGNVKLKLDQAREHGLRENAAALEKAQPAPLPKEKITPSLRGSWVPSSVFRDFLLDLGVTSPEVNIIPSLGRIVATSRGENPSAFAAEFRDDDRKIVDFFNSAASGKPLTVYYKDEKGNQRTDTEATKRVNAKAERLSKVFVDWVYSDEERTATVVNAFNKTMNTHVERKFDGTRYLKMPGASPLISLRETQKNAAWRMVQEKNVLLDHVVGAGKTFTIIAGVMERRRLGLARKPMIVVPNHLVVQWARDFYRLYPTARILAATPKDFEKKNRRRLLARIATGDFDAIIIGHSSFGYIETPPEDVKMVVDEKIDELRSALKDMRANGESKRTLGQIEDRIAKYEQQLADLLETDTDDLGVNLLDMGVDHLAVDEAHEFKNLAYATAGERVVGMNDPNGSKKAFGLYTKTRGIQARGGAVTFATGTPVSNSLVELYTVMSYLAHDDLAARNQSHFDAWSGAYAVTETKLEYTATQKLKPRRVLSALTNLQSLGQIYRGFGDVITMATIKEMYAKEVRARNKETGRNDREEFPVPKVKGGGRRLVSGPITAQQSEYMDYLVARMQAIQENASDPSYMKIDNALWVLTDARKMSLDIRTVDPTAERDENGKVMRAAASIKENYDRWNADRGTQLVFCDLSTPSKQAVKAGARLLRDTATAVFGEKAGKAELAAREGQTYEARWRWLHDTAEEMLADVNTDDSRREKIEDHFGKIEDADGIMATADAGFSVYDDLKAVLVEKGIPENEIAFIHDYETPDQKQKLFERVNAGRIRVLMGSSQKMGAGTNAQERLVALHHMDAPWRPSDVEQREGRIIRQGNALYQRDPDGFEVEITSYSTEGTSDTVMWQILARKAAAIEQFREGGLDAMEEDGGDSDQYADFMASSTGNPVFRLNLEAERRMTDLRAQHGGRVLAKTNAESFLRRYDRESASLQEFIDAADRAKPGDFSYDGTSGSIDELRQARAAAQRAYEKAMADFEAAWPGYEAAKRKREAAEEAGVDRKSLPKLPPKPEKPAVPTPLAANVVSKSGYARAALAALTDIKGKRISKEKGHFADVIYRVDIRLTDEHRINIGYTEAETPSASTKLQAALMPDRIEAEIADLRQWESGRLERMKRQKPEQEKIAATTVDDAEVRAAESLSAWYRAQVGFAEIAADLKRAERPNRYIQRETKRPLKGFGSARMAAPDVLEFEGETYDTSGIFIAGPNGSTLHDAVRRGDGRRAVVQGKTEDGVRIAERVTIEPDEARAALEADASLRRSVAAAEGAVTPSAAPATLAARMKVAEALNRELDDMGIRAQIDLSVMDKVAVGGEAYDAVNGLFQVSQGRGLIVIAMEAADRSSTLGHEAGHALRSEALWGKPYGLFTEREWRVLERDARADGKRMDLTSNYYRPDQVVEEVVMQRFAAWRSGALDASGMAAQAFQKIARFIEALGNALRGLGFKTADDVRKAMASGEIGRRGRDMGRTPAATAEAASRFSFAEAEAATVKGSSVAAAEPGMISNALTQAMQGRYNLLGLVPGRPLFAELAKDMPAAQEYLRMKGEMDALRNEWHARADDLAQRWRKLIATDGEANTRLMDLMHEATLAGADPSKPFKHDPKGKDEGTRKRRWNDLKPRFDALPEPFQAMFREVRDTYKALSDEFEKTLLDNIQKSMDVGLARAERAHAAAMQEARDEGLTGEALAKAKAAADKKLATAKTWGGWNKRSKMAELRTMFETGKVPEPYFPLARFGSFFVTVRDKESGAVVAFSRFEHRGVTPAIAAKRRAGLHTPQTQAEFAAEMRAEGYAVEEGTIGEDDLRDMVDPAFMADIEGVLQDAGVPEAVMDTIWQRWLESLPDMSIRKARIHRKGTPGFSGDAFRAFGQALFHGSHQLARLRYAMDLQEALDLTKAAARLRPDPVRASLVAEEMERRHEFTMNPKGAWWSQALTSAAFVWHLAVSPAAALVNLSQTTVIGIPILAGYWGDPAKGAARAAKELGRALVDFGDGRGWAERSKRLTADEIDALKEAYRRGTIDASQAHDLAGVSDSGIEYSDLRTKWMARISFFFHHTERLNREITFLAAYRMARAKGLEGMFAVDKASDLTWRTHFDYQNTSRPRAMQGDVARSMLVFRNYSANMLWRLFRDTHQALHGASAEDRREALTQLGGITASMALHAGVRGTWLYGLAMLLAGLFFDDGSDEAEETLKKGAISLLGPQLAKVVLDGVPGALTGTSLSERIGMPDLWFRSPDRPLEGEDLYLYWVEQMLGAGWGLLAKPFTAAEKASDGNYMRAIEDVLPKAARDILRAYRTAEEGVTTLKGDPITDPSMAQAWVQLIGFTPAKVAERYEANSRMRNKQERIEEDRQRLVNQVVADIKAGGAASPETVERIVAFNRDVPTYPITSDTIRRSIQGRARAAARSEFGLQLNPRLDQRIREEAAPTLY